MVQTITKIQGKGCNFIKFTVICDVPINSLLKPDQPNPFKTIFKSLASSKVRSSIWVALLSKVRWPQSKEFPHPKCLLSLLEKWVINLSLVFLLLFCLSHLVPFVFYFLFPLGFSSFVLHSHFELVWFPSMAVGQFYHRIVFCGDFFSSTHLILTSVQILIGWCLYFFFNE